MTEPTTHTLDVPGATLTYDVRPAASPSAPTLVMIGSPMGAAGFGTLSGHFTDRTVVTYDPRGVERSTLTEQVTECTPEEHAADVRAVIEAVGGGPVDLFASSGGAINALALVARHPELFGTLVAHEPPAATLLPDHEHALVACRAISDTYQRDGFGPAMAQFIAIVSHQGEITAEYLAAPPPDPAMFGLPTEDDGSRDDPLLGLNMVTSTGYRHDVDALRSAPTRIVVGVGAESGEEFAARSGRGVARALGQDAVEFPGGHGGFLGGEYGQTGVPDAFAARLREVLDGPAGA